MNGSGVVRIGTWNLAGRWTDRHRDLLLAQDCDVLLLTEVSERLSLAGYSKHATKDRMAADRHWAAVLSRRELTPGEDDPHPATAAAQVGDVFFVSSILPWRAAGRPDLWGGSTHAAKMAATLRCLGQFMSNRRVIWGGDWNQALHGKEYAGSNAGRAELAATIARLGLTVPTERLPHRLDGIATIDHVAVPIDTRVLSSARVAADAQGWELSDHDVYIIEVAGL